jgi:hypothetical protein
MSDIQPIPHAPVLRRLWVVVLLTCLLITFPIAMIVLLTGDVYRWRQGSFRPIGNSARYIYGGLLILWLVAVVAKSVMSPDTVGQQWAKSADPDAPNSAAAQPATKSVDTASAAATAPNNKEALAIPTEPAKDVPESCTSETAIDAVKSAIENGPDANTTNIKVEDFGKAKEIWFEQDRNARRCVAVAVLNTGQTYVTYQLYFGPSGKPMVQVQTGQAAEMQFEVDQAKREEAEEAAKPRSCDATVDNLTGKPVYPSGCAQP